MSADYGVGPGPRREIRSSADTQPHVTEGDRDAPLQQEAQSPRDIPASPANAHGADKQSTHDQPRDDSSMYEGRPGEDKDRAKTDMP